MNLIKEVTTSWICGAWLCNQQTLIHISRNQYGIHWLQWRCVDIMRKHTSNYQVPSSLQWRHNGRDSDSNHHPRDCLPNRLFRCRSKKTSNLRVTGFCARNSPVNSPHKWPVTRKIVPFDDVIIYITTPSIDSLYGYSVVDFMIDYISYITWFYWFYI